MFYSVSSHLYEEALREIKEAIGGENYFSGTIRFRFAEMDCWLRVSVIVYRQKEVFPEGVDHKIVDLVPVWWEFHTENQGVEILNDFSWEELRTYLS